MATALASRAGDTSSPVERPPGLSNAEVLVRRRRGQGNDFRPITPEAVKNALWIAEYGFDDQTFTDGAYYRMVMLGELSRARVIYVARPVRFDWVGALPTTYGDKEVFKTEMMADGSYFGERFQIELMNRLLRTNELTEQAVTKEGYHPVEIREVPIRVQRGFTGYVSEDIDVFTQAREEAAGMFAAATPESDGRVKARASAAQDLTGRLAAAR